MSFTSADVSSAGFPGRCRFRPFLGGTEQAGEHRDGCIPVDRRGRGADGHAGARRARRSSPWTRHRRVWPGHEPGPCLEGRTGRPRGRDGKVTVMCVCSSQPAPGRVRQRTRPHGSRAEFGFRAPCGLRGKSSGGRSATAATRGPDAAPTRWSADRARSAVRPDRVRFRRIGGAVRVQYPTNRRRACRPTVGEPWEVGFVRFRPLQVQPTREQARRPEADRCRVSAAAEPRADGRPPTAPTTIITTKYIACPSMRPADVAEHEPAHQLDARGRAGSTGRGSAHPAGRPTADRRSSRTGTSAAATTCTHSRCWKVFM